MKCQICRGQTKMWYAKLFDDRHGYPGYFDVYRCTNCGLGITSPSLSLSQISSVYRKYYPWHKVDLDQIHLADYQPLNIWATWRKGLGIDCHRWVKPSSTVLDIGCGVGYSLLTLKNMGCQTYGIDPEPTAKKLVQKFGVKFYQGVVEDQPFGQTKFDFITASQVLEHTPDLIRFLNTCRGRLAPGGKIILSFPNTDSLSRKLLGRRWLHWHVPYHFWHFSRRSVHLLARKTRLQITKLSTVTPNLWTNLQLRHLLMSHHPGQRDQFWDGKRTPLVSNPLTKSWSVLENHNYLNRFIDALELGESWVVHLEYPRG